MKLVWSPEAASKAYIDTVKSCEPLNESSVAELISAMAAGWNAQLVVETWSQGGATATSIGLACATQHTRGRHICVVPNEESREEYVEAMTKSGQSGYEIIIGEPKEAMEELEGVDFLVVDYTADSLARIFGAGKLSHRGAILICKNASSRDNSDFRWRRVLDGKRIVRSVFLPVGQGLDIVHVGALGGSGERKGKGRWFKHIDQRSGEEFVIRK